MQQDKSKPVLHPWLCKPIPPVVFRNGEASVFQAITAEFTTRPQPKGTNR